MAYEERALLGSTETSKRKQVFIFVAVACGALAACMAIFVVANSSHSTELLSWYTHNEGKAASRTFKLRMLNPGMRSGEAKDPDDPWGYKAGLLKMAKPQHQTVSMAQTVPVVHGSKEGLTMTEQYARIMQNLGYFAPWSRQNGWVDRVAIANIRKANTPQALAQRAEQIKQENAKFAREFSSPHTSQYTGMHESLQTILDPKYQPWGNDGPRKAYYSGF